MTPAEDTGPPLDPGFLDGWSERWFAAWEGRDTETIAAMCDEDLLLADRRFRDRSTVARASAPSPPTPFVPFPT